MVTSGDASAGCPMFTLHWGPRPGVQPSQLVSAVVLIFRLLACHPSPFAMAIRWVLSCNVMGVYEEQLPGHLDRRADVIAAVSTPVIFEPRRWNPRIRIISASS